MKIAEPTDEDLAHLSEQEATALRLLRSRYGDVLLTHTEADLDWLQRLVDDCVLGPDQIYELQCLGVVLGGVFSASTPLRWVVVEDDEFGRDLALQYPGTTIIVFPITMISKRVEDGREVDLLPIFRTLAAQVETMKDDPEYRR